MTQESLETKVARLDERLLGFQAAFSQIAEDQHRMAESYEKLVESNQRVALLEADMVAAKAGQAKLWEKYDAMDAENKRASQRWLWEIIRTILTIVAAVVAYKMFGVHA